MEQDPGVALCLPFKETDLSLVYGSQVQISQGQHNDRKPSVHK